MKPARAVNFARCDGFARAVLQHGFDLFIRSDDNIVTFCIYLHIADMILGAMQQIYIAENSVHTEEILVFKIASEAPFVNDDAERRLSGCASGQFKLRLQMTALSESDEFAVKINERA